MTGSITAAATKPALQVNPGRTAKYHITVATGKTYVGLAKLERSLDNGVTYATVVTFDGTGAGLDDTTDLAAEIANESGNRQLFRLKSTVLSTDALDFVLTQGYAATEASSRTHASMIAWLNTLPTADPSIAGEPYLSSGALKVSAG